ncbi:MAG: hypothetical protein K2X73_14805 [Sphingomonas sp.]|uniref:hypothetical protein n=1 Tax=Sphingomonas sp. TaxID=28214 RepID=UPI0025F1ABEC|nr:hypothetical protein [Sphingomonas sp.]MBX9883228.1 hypothetical protein [Sphingomonas sp.]
MRLLPFLLLVPLAGCVAPPTSAPAPRVATTPPPAPRPAPAPAPLATDWRDWSLTPGAWRYADGVASFGAPGADRLELRCAAGRQLMVTRPGSGAGTVTLRTTSGTRTFAAAGGTITLAANDPGIDAMGFSRGRFVLEQNGAAPLVVPVAPEVLRVAEDCRG